MLLIQKQRLALHVLDQHIKHKILLPLCHASNIWNVRPVKKDLSQLRLSIESVQIAPHLDINHLRHMRKKNAQINWPRVVSELLRPQPQPRKEIECALRVQQIPINHQGFLKVRHALVGQLVRQVNTPQPRRRKRAIGSAAIVIGGNSKFLQPLQAQIVCFVLLGKVLYLLRKVVPIALLENFKIKRLRGQQPAAFVQSVTNIQVQQPNVRRVQQARIKI